MAPSTERALALPVHGGPARAELAALGYSADEVVDFSVNVNPYGPSAHVIDAIRSAPLRAYPDPTSTRAREALAAATGRRPDEIVVGSGATELFWSFARAVLGPSSTAVVCTPCFAELPAAARSVGARVVEVRAEAGDGFDVDVGQVARAAHASAAQVIHLGAPSSPVGRAVASSAIGELAARCPDALVLLDESFLSLSERHGDLALPLPENVVRVRSLTKDHAIAGVRVGYLLADAGLARRIEATRPSWTTSTPAEAAAVAATGDGAFVAESRVRMLADGQALAGELAALGLRPVPSVAPYLVVAVPPALGDAAALRRRLLTRRLLVRDCASFGLPAYIRLAARPAGDRARLVSALREELSSC